MVIPCSLNRIRILPASVDQNQVPFQLVCLIVKVTLLTALQFYNSIFHLVLCSSLSPSSASHIALLEAQSNLDQSTLPVASCHPVQYIY